jgi:hypothetical protein
MDSLAGLAAAIVAATSLINGELIGQGMCHLLPCLVVSAVCQLRLQFVVIYVGVSESQTMLPVNRTWLYSIEAVTAASCYKDLMVWKNHSVNRRSCC